MGGGGRTVVKGERGLVGKRKKGGIEGKVKESGRIVKRRQKSGTLTEGGIVNRRGGIFEPKGKGRVVKQREGVGCRKV